MIRRTVAPASPAFSPARGKSAPSADELEKEKEEAQTKGAAPVRVSHPDDPQEREADRLSRALAAGAALTAPIGQGRPSIQRMCRSCEDKEPEQEPGGSKRSAGDANGLTGGQPLPAAQRRYFEPRLGRGLGDVRLHTDARAQELSGSLQANAFTYGRHIAFAPGQYRPETGAGRRLLAHELVHVVQQQQAPAVIQRDLATEPPQPAPAAQPDLTQAQVEEAIRFNARRFNATHTRTIQDIIGTAQTGTWAEEDVRALAAIQEEYGLAKDGKLGWETYRWLVEEIRNEGLRRTNANCPVAFWIDMGAQNIAPRNNGARMQRTFHMNADLPSYCGCDEFEYRQFIRGHFTITRGATVHDMGTWFANLPAGRLNAAFQEDGDTTAPAVNYGHRNQPAEPINRYLNDAGVVDQADGCRYRGRDTPGGNFGGWTDAAGVQVNPTTGDQFDILMQFRGEVQRNGGVVRSREWTAIRGQFALPA